MAERIRRSSRAARRRLGDHRGAARSGGRARAACQRRPADSGRLPDALAQQSDGRRPRQRRRDADADRSAEPLAGAGRPRLQRGRSRHRPGDAARPRLPRPRRPRQPAYRRRRRPRRLRSPPAFLSPSRTPPREDPRHRRHRLPRRRQDLADPPPAGKGRRAAGSPSSSTSSATSASIASCCWAAASGAAPRTTSSSCRTAASAAPSPTLSCRRCRSCSTGREPPDHIVIETSGLALPKPLVKAFNWPEVRARVTVDGVIAVVDAPAVAAGRFADDPDAVRRSAPPIRRSFMSSR